jgi:hypothetical protein
LSLGCKGLCVLGLHVSLRRWAARDLCLCAERVFVSLGFESNCVFGLSFFLSFGGKSFCVLPYKVLSVFGMQESVFGLQGSFCLSAARFFVLGVQVSLCRKGLCVFGL